MTSISALESNGKMHTFIVAYDQYTATLVIDLRKEATMTDGNVSLMRKSDAPTLEEVAAGRQPCIISELGNTASWCSARTSSHTGHEIHSAVA